MHIFVLLNKNPTKHKTNQTKPKPRNLIYKKVTIALVVLPLASTFNLFVYKLPQEETETNPKNLWRTDAPKFFLSCLKMCYHPWTISFFGSVLVRVINEAHTKEEDNSKSEIF